MNTATIELTAIDQMREYLKQAGAALLKAGQLYALEIDKDVAFRDKMRMNFPGITAAFLNDLESVGRGLLEPRIIEMGLSCGNRLRRLPVSQQKQLLDKGVSVWVGGDTRIIPLTECGPAVLMQCLAKDHVRSVEEQAAWHEEQNAKLRQEQDSIKRRKSQAGDDIVYRIDRKKRTLKILHACTLTAKDLSAILEEII